jgi:TP901 family phage tail tape measure protein
MARNKSVIQVVVTGEASRLQKAMRGAGSALGTFAALGIKAAAVVAQVGAAIGVAAVRQFANFDAAMTKSLAIMGDVSDAMRKDMSDAAREVAKTTTFSAEQAAEAYFFLASAGLDAEQSIAALPQVAAFAQAGMFDLAQATDLLTDAQSALGLTSDDAAENLANMTRLSDVLVGANTLANASVQQFSEALTNKAGAALRTMGKDVEEGVAVLALFADQGVKGTEAGEKLSIMLRDVTRAAAKNTDGFAKLGLEVLDGEGNLKNMADVVDEFTRVLGPMSDAQMAATLDQLGLTRAVGDSIRLTLGGADAIREYEAALRDAGGTTADVAAKQLDTFNAQLGLLKSALGDVLLGLGERLMPIFSGMVSALQENMPAIEAFIDTFMTGFEQHVLPVLQAVADFIVNNVGPALSRMGGFFSEEIVPAAKTMWAFFNDNILPVLNTLWGLIKDNLIPAFQSFARFIMDVIVPAVLNALRPALDGLNKGLEFLRGVIDENKDGFSSFFASARPIFEWIRDTGAPIIGTVLGGVFQLLAVFIGGVINVMNKFLSVIAKVIDKVRDFINIVAESAIGRGISSIIDAVTGRQYGGLVTPNRPFLVGEQGPEMFVPMGAGRIMPEVPMMVPEFVAPERGGGGDTYVINVSGAIDPEGTARTILRVLDDAQRRTGVRMLA